MNMPLCIIQIEGWGRKNLTDNESVGNVWYYAQRRPVFFFLIKMIILFLFFIEKNSSYRDHYSTFLWAAEVNSSFRPRDNVRLSMEPTDIASQEDRSVIWQFPSRMIYTNHSKNPEWTHTPPLQTETGKGWKLKCGGKQKRKRAQIIGLLAISCLLSRARDLKAGLVIENQEVKWRRRPSRRREKKRGLHPLRCP